MPHSHPPYSCAPLHFVHRSDSAEKIKENDRYLSRTGDTTGAPASSEAGRHFVELAHCTDPGSIAAFFDMVKRYEAA